MGIYKGGGVGRGDGGAGTGDVSGPATSVSGNIAVFDNVSGNAIRDDSIAVADVVNPIKTAFSGVAAVTERFESHTFWTAGLWLDPAEDRVGRALVVTPAHVALHGSRLEVDYSEDGGNTWAGKTTAYASNNKAPITAAIGNMASGRIGGILTCWADVNRTTGSRAQFFVYSDDAGATWASVELTGLVIDHFVYGMIQPLSTAHGGNDTTGFCVATYAGTAAAKALVTQNNGASWSEVTLKAGDANIPSVQEPSLVQTSRGWVMFVRGAANGNLWCATSTDFSAWSAWIDCNVPLGSNPVHALNDGDTLSIAVTYREDFVGSVDENMTIVYMITANEFFDGGADLSSVEPVTEWSLPSRGIGYFFSKQRADGNWLHFCKAGETAASTSGDFSVGADAVFITTVPRPFMGVSAGVRSRQILDNSAFDLWENGASFNGITADKITANRWRTNVSGSTMAVTRIELAPEVRNTFGHRPRYGLRIDTAGGGSDFAGIYQWYRGDDAIDMIKRIKGRAEVHVVVCGTGQPIPKASFLIQLSFGTGGSATLYERVTLPRPNVNDDGTYVQTARLAVEGLTDSTFGPGAYVKIGLDNYNDVAPYDTTLCGVFVYLGPPPPETQPVDFVRDQQRAALYQQSLAPRVAYVEMLPGYVANSTTCHFAMKFFPEMVDRPNAMVRDFAQWRARNSGIHAATSLAMSEVTRQGAKVALGTSGVTANDAVALQAVSSSAEIIFQTGY